MLHLNKLRNLCDRENITLKQLAQELKLSERTIHLMLNQNTTKLSTLEEISKFFNVDISYFFQTDDEVRAGLVNDLITYMRFTYEYDIKTLFKVEEEYLLKGSFSLKSFIDKTQKMINKNIPTDETVTFTRSMLDNPIKNLFYSLEGFTIEALKELEQICDEIFNQLCDILRNETIKPFIREEMFSSKDIDMILKTYFMNDSILLKPKIWILKKQLKK